MSRDSKNNMAKLFGNYFLDSLISVAQSVFGTNSAIVSGWDVPPRFDSAKLDV